MDRREQIRTAAEKASRGVGGNWEHIRKGAELWFIRGAIWADSHPNWISVEEELPKEKGKYMFRLSNGDMYYETYYPKLKLLDNVTHWMEIQPPRKEDKK